MSGNNPQEDKVKEIIAEGMDFEGEIPEGLQHYDNNAAEMAAARAMAARKEEKYVTPNHALVAPLAVLEGIKSKLRQDGLSSEERTELRAEQIKVSDGIDEYLENNRENIVMDVTAHPDRVDVYAPVELKLQGIGASFKLPGELQERLDERVQKLREDEKMRAAARSRSAALRTSSPPKIGYGRRAPSDASTGAD